MRFICVASPKNKESVELLRKAAEARQLEFVYVDIETFNFSEPLSPEPGDLLYQCSVTPEASIIEQLLDSEYTTTFYSSRLRANSVIDNVVRATILHEHSGISIPPTIYTLPAKRAEIDAAVEKLGGYPIIIKATGGSHGVGIIKADSATSLYSVIDFLRSTNEQFIMRQFIDVTNSARLIVLGDTVIDSIMYSAPKGDFRSNEGHQPNVSAQKFDPETEAMAVKATQVLGIEFGGVDILIDKNNQKFVTEVNFPCYFPRSQNLTGVDIAGQMLDHLINKSQLQAKTLLP